MNPAMTPDAYRQEILEPVRTEPTATGDVMRFVRPAGAIGRDMRRASVAVPLERPDPLLRIWRVTLHDSL